ncbi:MAG: DNA polymerase III subunit gamma/tau [Armatimonadota bacterium]|nr:DNA polymerase III subunit gamma/tau [Armatimonadota bacterium]
MAYQTFALKYRPQTFDDIVGQDHVAITLKNAVAEGRVAHGYLFAGPRGTGKTSTARVLAKALCCEQGPTPTPCCECAICEAIGSGRAMDVIEIDAASHRGIDDIRELRDKIAYAPTQARYKFYILDEAHQLTDAASNALLKTLEEPPEHAYFVLCTTEPHNILPTIRSRCQSFEFRPIPTAQIVEALREIADSEGVEVNEAALGAIARAAGGAMRDAESILDQVIAYGRGEVSVELVNSMLGVTDAELLASLGEAVAAGDVEGVFTAVDDVVASGKDISQLMEDLGVYFRDLLRLSLGVTPPAWMQTPTAGQDRMQAQAESMGPRRLSEIVETLAEASRRLRETSQQSLLLEVTLAHLAAVAPAEAAPEPPAAETPATAQAGAQPPAEEPPPEAERPETATAAEAAREEPAPEEETALGPAEPPEPVELPEGETPLEAIREHWHRVGRQLRADEHTAALALIAEASPMEVEGDTITLTFPDERAWECGQAGRSHRRPIEAAVEAVFGRELRIRCICPGAPEDAAAAAEQQERMVEALKLNFDGELDTPEG